MRALGSPVAVVSLVAVITGVANCRSYNGTGETPRLFKPQMHNTLVYPYLAIGIPLQEPQTTLDHHLSKRSTEALWREDYACGPYSPLPSGHPAQCNPRGIYPCCGTSGWCGNTPAHCVCSRCIDYRGIDTSVPSEANCGVGEFACSNFKCISKRQTCNGQADCPDGADEEHCEDNSRYHGPHANHFTNKQCEVIGLHRDKTLLECENLCDETGGCTAFNFETTRYNCVLRKCKTPQPHPLGNAWDWVSWTKNLPTEIRADGRCGKNFLGPSGRPAQCLGPCCSYLGWCGNTYDHCTDWPAGPFALPKPITGCPVTSSKWLEGTRAHNTEESDEGNSWSSPIHLAGIRKKDVIKQEFCVKVSQEGSLWPSGDYCIYKFKSSCPYGFDEGSIFMDDVDTNNSNNKSGSLPDGVFSRNTLYRYCCRNDGNSQVPIHLPVDTNYFLFPYKSGCQKVVGMESILEWMRFDNEDDDNENNAEGAHPKLEDQYENTKIYYCYYHQGWPEGPFGLPKPSTGCPLTNSKWLEGTRVHDTEESDDGNSWSDQIHLAGIRNKSAIRQEFCLKASQEGLPWPAGDYCIYKFTLACPQGFDVGTIYMDDDHDDTNNNSGSGTLPDGNFDHNTMYKYCCRNDGNSHVAIHLPIESAFYLFPYQSGCQKVVGMGSIMEWMHFDNEDNDNQSNAQGAHPKVEDPSGNTKLYYCYYYDIKEPGLVYKYTDDYTKIWNATSAGGKYKISVWSANNFQNGFCSVGDTVHNEFDRPNTKAIMLSAKKQGILVKPNNFTEVYTGKHKDKARNGYVQYRTIYRMNAPAGYTCLGDVTMSKTYKESRRNEYKRKFSQPDKNKYCCVKNSYIVHGNKDMVYNDKGINGIEGVSLFKVIRGTDVSGIEGGSFLSDRNFDRPTLGYLLKDDGIEVINDRSQQLGDVKSIYLHEVHGVELIWDSKGTGSDVPNDKLSIWRPKSLTGHYSIGDLAVGTYDEPSTAFLISLSDPDDQDSLRFPTSYEEIWNNEGPGSQSGVSIWRLICPSGYVSLGNIATVGHRKYPDLNACKCVKHDYVISGSNSKTNWRKIWDNHGSNAFKDVTIYEAVGATETQQRTRGFGTIASHDGYPGMIYLLNVESINYIAEPPIEKIEIYNVNYNMDNAIQLSTPGKIKNTIIHNKSSRPQKTTREINYSYEKSSTWDFNLAIEKGVTVEVSAGIPDIFSMGVTTSYSETRSFGVGETITATEVDTITAEIGLDASSQISATVSYKQYKTDIPYTADMKKYYFDGTTSIGKVSGVFKGVDAAEFVVEYGEMEEINGLLV